MRLDSMRQPGAIHQDGTATKPARFPVKMTILTAVVGTAAVLAQIFISEIEDAAHAGLDVVMIVTILTTAGLTVLWLGWILIFSRWRWWKRLIGAMLLIMLPFAIFKVFRPVHGGDANLLRFEPIWAQRKALPVDTPVAAADLSIESPTDFPRFLGSNQNGKVTSSGQIDASNFAENCRIIWKQPIGAGWSGFSGRNGYAVTMEQRGDQECVTCYDITTGTLKWIYSHSARHRDKIGLGRIGPRSTPTIHESRVYSVGAVGNLVCLNGADGSLVWQKDLNKILGIVLKKVEDTDGLKMDFERNTSLAWGRSGSPLIVDDLVIVPGGGPDGPTRATLLAFDAQSGDLR